MCFRKIAIVCRAFGGRAPTALFDSSSTRKTKPAGHDRGAHGGDEAYHAYRHASICAELEKAKIVGVRSEACSRADLRL